MNEKFVTVVLHGWIEFFSYQVFEASRIQNDLLSLVEVKCIVYEKWHHLAVFVWVVEGANVFVFLIFLVDVIVAKLINRKQALQTRIHIAIQVVILQSNDAVPQLLDAGCLAPPNLHICRAISLILQVGGVNGCYANFVILGCDWVLTVVLHCLYWVYVVTVGLNSVGLA